jgi:multiple sugar transport system substrate-binding protein
MKTRMLAMLLAALLIATALPFSCAMASEPVTITFSGWEASPLETESVRKGIELFESQNPDIKVEYIPLGKYEDYATKLLTSMAGNAAPDVFFLGSAMYGSYIEKNVLLDLTDKFYQSYKDEDFIPSALNIMKRDGKIYGVSSCTVSQILYYNKEIFDAAGEPYPPSNPDEAWTWAELAEVAKRLTKGEGDIKDAYGFYFNNMAGFNEAIILQAGNTMFSEDQTTFIANDPSVIQAIGAIRDLRLVDGSMPSASTLTNVGMNGAQMLQTGKIAMLADGSWALQELATLGFPVGIGVLPRFENSVTQGQAHVHAAWVKTPHPEEAWKFLEFLSGNEYQTDLIRSGLWMPNKTYLYSEEGVKSWYDESVHTAAYLDMLDYFESAPSMPTALLGNGEIETLELEMLDEIYKNDRDIAEVMAEFETRANKILAE